MNELHLHKYIGHQDYTAWFLYRRLQELVHETVSPYNFFRNPSDSFIVCVILPLSGFFQNFEFSSYAYHSVTIDNMNVLTKCIFLSKKLVKFAQ